MTRALTVLCDSFQGLADQVHIILVYIKAEQAEASSGASTNAVQELKGLTYQIVIRLVVLVAEKVLKTTTFNHQGIQKHLDLKLLKNIREASTCSSELWFSQSS